MYTDALRQQPSFLHSDKLTPVPQEQRTVLPGNCPGIEQVMDGCIDEHGTFVPEHQSAYNGFVRIKLPKSLEDPHHWGQVAWIYVQFAKDKKDVVIDLSEHDDSLSF